VPSPTERRLRVAGSLLLLALVAAVYLPAARNPFVVLDDPEYVARNPVVARGLSADTAAWAFTDTRSGIWQPLTWLSHMADVSLFGLEPGGHHAVSVLLHGANAVLLFLFLASAADFASARRAPPPGAAPLPAGTAPSLAAAALFAVHPVHVESVAWIAERRDVLCAFFFLLALHAWLRYVRRPGGARHAAVAALFAASLMAKPMAVTFPVLLLVLDAWPLGRGPFPGEEGDPPPLPAARLLSEKIPLLALSAAFTAGTLLVARGEGNTLPGLDALPLPARVGNAFLSYAAYLGKAAWPARLSVVYPHPWAFPETVPVLATAASVLLFLALWGAAIRLRRSRPWLLAGWGWYTVALLPAIGLVQVGDHGMADRYAYLPFVGIYFAVAWTARDLAGEEPLRRKGAVVAAALVVAALAVAARGQLSLWRDPVRLFTRAIESTERNYQASYALGSQLLWEGRPAEAERAFRATLSLCPVHAGAWGALGRVLLLDGRGAEAEAALRKSLELDGTLGESRKLLGVALQRAGRHGEAAASFLEAARRDPLAADARYNLAISEEALGRAVEAERWYREAIRIRPGYGKAYNNLGFLLLRTGRAAEAVDALRAALAADPEDGTARANLEAALAAAAPPPAAGAR
jgi:tetratricopeptide (TPR) repeat protein